jgi:hypothetical protein
VLFTQAGRNGLFRSFKRLKVNNSVTDGAKHALNGDVLRFADGYFVLIVDWFYCSVLVESWFHYSIELH